MLFRDGLTAVFASVVTLSIAGCGGEEVKYEPKPPPKEKATLPAVPNVPQRPLKNGDTYTVWGASYSLRSRVLKKEVSGKDLSISGYIVKTNLEEAPECAVHKAGEADPEGCVAPIPAFWIADTKDAPLKDSIKVMGWASNFAQLYDAIEEYNKAKEGEEPKELYQDTFWAKPIPFPIPAKGAKVTVTGPYSTTFTGASGGAEADPIMGILTYQKLTYQEKPAEMALLPGMKKK